MLNGHAILKIGHEFSPVRMALLLMKLGDFSCPVFWGNINSKRNSALKFICRTFYQRGAESSKKGAICNSLFFKNKMQPIAR